jgi:protein-tyrosine phosphatase
MTNTTHIPLEGALNLRDIGGYTGHDGATLARGIVFRSDNLNTLTDNDLVRFDELGIRSVFDFRGDREVELQPSRFWSSVNNPVRLPISDENVQEKTLVEKIESRELTEVTDADVAESYVSILESNGHQFAPLLHAIADDTKRPLLFHCTAGKDRTGLAAALIHSICGVSRADIVADFELSNEYRLKPRLEALRQRFDPQGIDLTPLIPALGAPPLAMHEALDHLEAEHDGVMGFITNRLGVDNHTIAAIQSTLLIR